MNILGILNEMGLSKETLDKIRSLKNKQQGTQTKEIQKPQNNGNAKKDLYARAEIWVDGYPKAPQALKFAKEVFKIPEERKEFEEKCLSVYNDLTHQGRMHDNYELVSPICKIITAIKSGDSYQKVGDYQAKTQVGIRKIIESISGLNNNQQSLPGKNVVTYNVYVDGRYGKEERVSPIGVHIKGEDGEAIQRIDIVKNGKRDANENWHFISSETYNSINRKIKLLKNKLEKKNPKIDAIMVNVELVINGKVEDKWNESIWHIRTKALSGYHRFDPFEKLEKTYNELKKDGIITESFKYLKY